MLNKIKKTYGDTIVDILDRLSVLMSMAILGIVLVAATHGIEYYTMPGDRISMYESVASCFQFQNWTLGREFGIELQPLCFDGMYSHWYY